MEKQIACRFGRSGVSIPIALIFLFLFISYHLGMAQSGQKVEPGVIRIKVSEVLAAQFEQMPRVRTADNIMLTGVRAIDVVHRRYAVREMQRVFPPAGKFEAKHRKYGLHRWYEVRADDGISVSTLLAAFKDLEHIEKAEPIHQKAIVDDIAEGVSAAASSRVPSPVAGTLPRLSNDQMLSGQWHYHNNGSNGGRAGADISLLKAWEVETGSPNVVVAIQDGGIQLDHPDLRSNLWINSDEVAGNQIDDDGNGYVDDVHGYSFADRRPIIEPNLHGTHVAGTVAATSNNSIGVAGVAGGSGQGDGVRLMSCAVFSASFGRGVAESFAYSADNGAVISQNSWGYTQSGVFDQADLDGIEYFIAEAGRDEHGNQTGPMNGGIVIFAAGNNNTNASWYPAYYNAVIAVASTDNRDEKAHYSNYGPWVDIAAPGGETNELQIRGVLSTFNNGDYGRLQGTSMACPHVSGVAALAVSKFGGPGYTPQMLRERLLQQTDDIYAYNPAFNGMLGSGRLNANKVLQTDDHTGPAAITDLAGKDPTHFQITLTWRAPADAGNGSAASYDMRYSTDPITPENFASATRINHNLVPKPAGQPESFTVTSLEPNNTYYFAIRSADQFGNLSALSNVVAQPTAQAPAFRLSRTSWTVTLKTAETYVRYIRISNLGPGVLNLSLTNKGPGHYSTFSPMQASVPSGGQIDIKITFDAHNLAAGTYQERWEIHTNDPYRSIVNFFTTLTVIDNGLPIVSVDSTALDFGNVPIGAEKTKHITFHNDGSEPLVISQVSSTNGEFTTDFPGTWTIAPFQQEVLSVTYTASGLGVSEGTLTVHTSDPARPTLQIALRAEALEPPIIAVQPATIVAAANTGQTVMQPLMIRNDGASTLRFSVGTSDPSADSIIHVAVLTADDRNQYLLPLLNDLYKISAEVFPISELPSLTVDDLLPYDVVIVKNAYSWRQEGMVNPPSRIGDVLADYADRGGKVIINQFAFASGWQSRITGRFTDEFYGPFLAGLTPYFDQDYSLDTVLLPAHPIMKGIQSIQYRGSATAASIAPGAQLLANWDDGTPFLAVKNNVVGMNLWPEVSPSNNVSGDVAALYENAIRWLTGPKYLTVSPVTGSVEPGEAKTVTVSLSAVGLSEKDTFHASIHIYHNVPSVSPVEVPVTFTVRGHSFSFSEDSVSVALAAGNDTVHSLVMYNNTAEDRTFDITAYPEAPYLQVIPSTGVVAANDSVVIQLRFDATNLMFGRYTTDLTIALGTDLFMQVPVALQVTGDPSLQVIPEALQATVDFREDTVVHFQIRNTGGAPLAYTLQTSGTEAEMEELLAMLTTNTTRRQYGGSSAKKKVTAVENRPTDSSLPATALSLLKGEVLLDENFESGVFPPSGWQVLDHEPFGWAWKPNADYNEGNYCGTGTAAMALVYSSGEEIDTELITPLIPVQAFSDVVVQFAINHQGAILDLDIEVDGSGTWTTVETLPYTGEYLSLPGSIRTINLSEHLEGASSFRLRWHHYMPDLYDFQDYSQIDDVVILANAVEWLSISPPFGTIPVGGVADISATFMAYDLEAGVHTGNILINSNAPGQPLLPMEVSLTVREPASVTITPDSLYQELVVGDSAIQTLHIDNRGASALKFSFEPAPESVTANAKKRPVIVSAEKREQPSQRFLGHDDTRAIALGDPMSKTAVQAVSDRIYYTRFEGLYLGDIDRQENWQADLGGLWIVSDEHPFSAVQHLRGVSDGLGIAVAVSPTFAEGPDDISSTTMRINLDSAAGVTWEVIPQRSSIGYVCTRVRILPDGRAQALVQDSSDFYESYYVDIATPVPTGYFELRIDVDRSVEEFTVYFDNKEVFRGETVLDIDFIEEVAFVSRMEVAGPTMDVDNFALFNGIPATAWVYGLPTAGRVPGHSTANATIVFNARDVSPGVYTHTVNMATNDPARPNVGIPATMRVLPRGENRPPVFVPVSDTTVAELGILTLTFSASDPDDSTVVVTLQNAPPFSQLLERGNGFATYRFTPGTSHTGDYQLTLIATDTRGAASTTTFDLAVVPYGVHSFSVINTMTGAVVMHFDDSVVLNASHPDFAKYNIRANTAPGKVGSVLFKMDGVVRNVANKAPYMFHRTALRSLSPGAHMLTAEAYTLKSGTGVKKNSKDAVVVIESPPTLTSFDVVNRQGQSLMALAENSVIDTSAPGFGQITIRANTVTPSVVKSVKFYLNGSLAITENLPPFTLNGGNYLPWHPAPGPYTLTAVPYARAHGAGAAGPALTVNFTVIANALADLDKSKSGAAMRAIGTADESGEVSLHVYPVPVGNHLTLSFTGLREDGAIAVSLLSIHGQRLYGARMPAAALQSFDIDVGKLGLRSGVYYLCLQTDAGFYKAVKFIKE